MLSQPQTLLAIDQDEIESPNVVYLSQSDVESGTYRITEPGTYILSEDLRFNFNAPTPTDILSEDYSPNNYDLDNLAWFPTSDQLHSVYADFYSFGFFAGISVECDNVTIDLNNHFMEMTYSFYLQQRFFTLIQLGNRPFIAGHGVSLNDDDDSNEIYPSFVTIQNGLLGLSSHHSIRGNNVNGLQILDVTMHNFDIGGVACNGCQSVSISDSIIGPQNTNIPVLGRYTHARALLPRLRYLNPLCISISDITLR